MRSVRKYALTLLATTSLVTVVLLVTGWGSAVAAQISNVFVTNTAADPVPVSGSVSVSNLPATQSVSGTVNIGNFPSSQTVDGSVSPAAPAAPVLLRADLPASPGSSSTLELFNDRTGATTQPHRIAVGSITVTTQGGTATSGIYVDLRGTDCHGNGLAGIADLTVHGDSTEHLDFPVPEIIPVAGDAPFCVVAEVLNGNELGGGNLTIRLVGYEG
jgi:hypothetical protein